MRSSKKAAQRRRNGATAKRTRQRWAAGSSPRSRARGLARVGREQGFGSFQHKLGIKMLPNELARRHELKLALDTLHKVLVRHRENRLNRHSPDAEGCEIIGTGSRFYL